MPRPLAALTAAALLALAAASPAAAAGPADADALHASYDALLQRHVRGLGVDYAAWKASAADTAALARYVEGLAALDPAGWPDADALAYWLDQYNALTLRLVLDNHPLRSIKDLGGLFRSPWKRELVTVAGRRLTLDQIENEVIRPRFRDPRSQVPPAEPVA